MAYPDPEMEKITDGTHCRLSSTLEFQQIAESIYGKDLDWFFDAYLHYAEIPELIVNQSCDLYTFRWQTSSALIFQMPLQILVDGELKSLEMTEGTNTITAKVDIEIDPQKWILMNVTTN